MTYLTESELWHRNLAKIERRLRRNDLEEWQREQLFELRSELVHVGEVVDLDRQLREIVPPHRTGDAQ